MIKFKFGEFSVSGILCSGNKVPGWTKSRAKNIDCFTKVKTNPDFDIKSLGFTIVFCPPGCTTKK